jgi:hypothetical protein
VCAAHGITTGKTATTFKPGDNITRQQLISMVVRAAGNALSDPPSDWSGVLKYGDPTHGENIRKAEFSGLLKVIKSLSSWNTSGAATRGECAQILWNLMGKLE